MVYHCRKCRKTYRPTPHQLNKGDYICKPCRRQNDKAWRLRRKLEGRPVITGNMMREWHREYEQNYRNRPGVRERIAGNQKRYVNDPRLRQRHECRWILNRAVRSGRIIKQSCSHCGNINGEAHHEDYSKPLNVIWLCRQCHAALHYAKAEGKDTR